MSGNSCAGLRRRIQRKAALYPGRYDLKLSARARSLRDFDDQITARYCGFADAQDYYTRAASSRVLESHRRAHPGTAC